MRKGLPQYMPSKSPGCGTPKLLKLDASAIRLYTNLGFSDLNILSPRDVSLSSMFIVSILYIMLYISYNVSNISPIVSVLVIDLSFLESGSFFIISDAVDTLLFIMPVIFATLPHSPASIALSNDSFNFL
jgi:K+-sensing histidine kinase KdpD